MDEKTFFENFPKTSFGDEITTFWKLLSNKYKDVKIVGFSPYPVLNNGYICEYQIDIYNCGESFYFRRGDEENDFRKSYVYKKDFNTTRTEFLSFEDLCNSLVDVQKLY